MSQLLISECAFDYDDNAEDDSDAVTFWGWNKNFICVYACALKANVRITCILRSPKLVTLADADKACHQKGI